MKLIRHISSFLACLIGVQFVLLQSAAWAATISITPSYVQSFDAEQNPLGKLAGNGATTPLGGYLQYEFRLSVDELTADEDFWTAIFDVQLGPGLENASGWLDPGIAQANGYYPAAPSLSMYDSNGSTPGGIQAHWQYGNADFGQDSNDLKSIIIETSPTEAANRQYGETIRPAQGAADNLGSPTLLGTVVVRRDEMMPSFISIAPIAGSAWGVYTDNALGDGIPTAQPPGTLSASTLDLAVPEPGTFVLAFSAIIFGLVCASRRPRISSYRGS
jgi:hypothetical protein